MTETVSCLDCFCLQLCHLMQSGCTLCVWDMYRDALHEYRVQQAKLKGESVPVKAPDPFEEMERKPNGLAEEGKGPKA